MARTPRSRPPAGSPPAGAACARSGNRPGSPSGRQPGARRHDSAPDPDACARCAAQGPTCCSTTPGQEEFCFPLSRSEWDRIVEWCDHVGGFATERNSLPFVNGMKLLFPGEEAAVEALFPLHGEHLRLAVSRTGDCLFLGAEGCRLPRQVRPWYCQLFPLWMRGERITMFTPDQCVAVREGRILSRVLESVRLTEKDVRLLFGRLRLAWGLAPTDAWPNVTPDAGASEEPDARTVSQPGTTPTPAPLPKPQALPDPQRAPRGRRRPPRPGGSGPLDGGQETL